jgi:hypothetical protein
MNGIKILQIYQDMDLRNGDIGLSLWLKKKTIHRRDKLGYGEVILFWNRAGNLCKIMSADSILVQRLPKGRTWSFLLQKKRDVFLSMIGRAFGLSWNTSKQVYETARKKAGIK